MKSLEELHSFLTEHNIPLLKWGTGKAKTIHHLLKEIQSGEAIIYYKNSQLVREVLGSGVFIYHLPTAEKLIETKQVFTDGRERTRTLDVSISEKISSSEHPRDGALRALREELGINELLPLEEVETIVKGPLPSDSYPGIVSLYHLHRFSLALPTTYYNPNGYKEIQEDKTNYYGWVPKL